MFMDSESFYYSLTYDLTNSVQRQSAGERELCPLWQKVPLTAPSRGCHQNNLWTRLASIGELKQHVSELFVFYLFQVDDRFFWNKYMIQDLTEIGVSSCF